MNEMDLVRDRFAEPPPPTPQVSARALARLDAEIAGRRAPRVRARVPWRVVGIPAGLVTGTAAVALTVTLMPGGSPAITPSRAPTTSTPTSERTSAREVLLVAAKAAQNQPLTDGAYWRVSYIDELTVRRPTNPVDLRQLRVHWYGKDGRFRTGVRALNGPYAGKAILSQPEKNSRPFELADQLYTLQELQDLPTDPAGIVAWAREQAKGHSPHWRKQDIESFVDDLLMSLLAQAPAGPRARAAAFRALAERPNIKAGGVVRDPQGRTGRELLMAVGLSRYIVDPDTATLLSESNSDRMKRKVGTRVYLQVGWTNDEPHPPAQP